jgi:hypothetical protein
VLHQPVYHRHRYYQYNLTMLSDGGERMWGMGEAMTDQLDNKGLLIDFRERQHNTRWTIPMLFSSKEYVNLAPNVETRFALEKLERYDGRKNMCCCVSSVRGCLPSCGCCLRAASLDRLLISYPPNHTGTASSGTILGGVLMMLGRQTLPFGVPHQRLHSTF